MDVVVERSVKVAPARVMQALTSEWELLRWCGERAMVTESAYQVEGAALPGGAMGGRLLERQAGLLQFEWSLGGEASTVEVRLEPLPQESPPPAVFTRVCVKHSAIPGGALAGARWEQESWECVWSLWLRRLQTWVERAEAPGLFAFGAPFVLPVVRRLELDSPLQRVWHALLDPAVRRRWLTVELGEELSRQEGRQVAFRFQLPGEPERRVTWRLTPREGGRTLVEVQEDDLTGTGLDNHLGWHEYLVALYQETARPLIRFTTHMAAPPERVWRYLGSEAGMRRWWNQAMRFEPFVGGEVYFEAHGGRLSGRVVAFEPNRRLAFSWTELDQGWPEPEPLLLTVELAAEGSGTQVTLTHSGFENLPEAIRDRNISGYQRGWALSNGLGNLQQQVESDGGPGEIREIRFSAYMAAPPQQVWRAVQSQEQIRRWLGKLTEYEPGLGGRVRVYDNTGEYVMGGVIVAWEPGRKLAFTWEQFAPTTHGPTLLTFAIAPEGEGSRVTILHDHFAAVAEQDYHDYRRGWGSGESQLAKIAAIAAEGELP